MRCRPVVFVTLCLVLLLGCPLAGYAAFFTASEISELKETPLPSDRSVTIGKLFDTYQHCQDGKWTLHETDRGQKYVEFRGKYSNLSLVLSRIKPHFSSTPDSVFKEIARSLDSNGFTVELVAQFMIAADGKSYQTAFLGFDYKGETPRVSSATIERGFHQIHQNSRFTETLPNEAIRDFDYYYKKYVLGRADKKQFAFSAQTTPIAIYKITDINFDDKSKNIILTANCDITDLTLDDVRKIHGDNVFINYSLISQSDLHFKIIDIITFKVFLKKDSEIDITRCYFSEPDRKSHESSYISFDIRNVMPIEISNMRAEYNGEFSEAVHDLLKKIHKEREDKKRAEQEKAQAQRQADEQWRQSILAARDTPYTGPASQKEREKREARAKAAQEAREAQRKEAEAARLRAQEEKAAKARAAKEAKAAQEKEALAAALGTYTNKTNGSLVLAESQTKPGLYSVVVGTTTNRGKNCNFTGECTPGKKGGFVCKISESDERNSIGLKFDKDMISISDFEYALENICGDSVPPVHRSFRKSVTEDTPASSTIKVNTGAYSYQESGFTGELVISDMTNSPNKYYLNISTNNTAEGDTCSFEGECILREGKLICTDDLIKEDTDNYIEIIPKENNILDITKQFTGPCGMRSYLTGIYAPTCLDKILETKTITGMYLGWFEAEEGVNTIGLKLSGSNKEIYIAASEEEANRLFGKTTGQKISVTYDVKQVSSMGSCDTINIMKTGKVLP